MAVLILLGFTAGAVNTGTNLLFAILGLIGSLLIIEGRRTRQALRGVEAERIAPRTVVRGEPALVTVRLRARDGAGRRLPFLVQELDPHAELDREARLLVWRIEPDTVTEATWQAAFARRGPARLEGLALTCRGSCGLLETTRELALRDAVLVLPRQRRLRDGSPLGLPAPPAERRPRPFGAERRDVVRSLRELRPGDDPRTIHWRATARRGELVVREFERGGPEGALVLLDLAPPPGLDDDEAEAHARAEATVEAAVELSLALLDELLRRGETAGLGVAGQGPPTLLAPGGTGLLPRAREVLALARPAPVPDLRQLLRAVGRQARELRLLLVTTRPAGQARAAAGGASLSRVLELASAEDAEAWLVPEAPDAAAEEPDPAELEVLA